MAKNNYGGKKKMSRLKDWLIEKIDDGYSFEETEEILKGTNNKREPPEYNNKEDF